MICMSGSCPTVGRWRVNEEGKEWEGGGERVKRVRWEGRGGGGGERKRVGVGDCGE